VAAAADPTAPDAAPPVQLVAPPKVDAGAA
jgi:hypothetical protein